MDWNDGYVADIEYEAGFFPEQSPSHLNVACVLNGVEPIPLDKPFTYFELGCGRGLTANILAASNPQGSFYAADFNPAQVAGARQLAATAQLENLTFLENNFAELADGKVPLPQLDFITMYGVYTWVNAENRRHIVRFIDRYLKPGGIVFLSYNVMPGWSAALPLQRLMLEYAARCPGRTGVQIEQLRNFIGRLDDMQAAYFCANPAVKYRLDSLMTDKASYLAHEYMNQGWQPLYYADVARDLAAAKLDYVGSAELPMAFPRLYLTPEKQEMLAAMPDAAMRETVKDYLLNTPFRQDVFMRGTRRMTSLRQMEWLQQMGLALTVPREAATHEIAWAFGKMNGREDVFIPILDALATGPRTLAELTALPALNGHTLAGLAEVAALLTASAQAAPYFACSARMDSESAHRMNRAVAQQSSLDDDYQTLASPLLGNGVGSGLVQRLIYLSLCQQLDETDAAVIADRVRRIMAEQGRRITAPGDLLELEEAEVRRTVSAILEKRLPVWRQLGVL